MLGNYRGRSGHSGGLLSVLRLEEDTMNALPAVAALIIGLAVVGADTHGASAQGHASGSTLTFPALF